MNKNEFELFGGDKPGIIKKTDPKQEDPKLLRLLERNNGDLKSAMIELVEDFDNPETRVIMARLIRKKNESDRVVH